MCGILGILSPENKHFNQKLFRQVSDALFILSENRGKESAGVALKIDQELRVLKQPTPATKLIKNSAYRSLFTHQTSEVGQFLIGHARLVTNGKMDDNANNQPVIKDNMIGVHNGIITNIEALWQKHQNLNRQYEVDTEILLSLMRKGLKQGKSLAESAAATFSQIEGAASIGLTFADFGATLLATNTGSLYFVLSKNKDILIFASEYDILLSLFDRINLQKYFSAEKIQHLEAGSGLIVSDEKLKMAKFSLKKPGSLSSRYNIKGLSIRDFSTYNSKIDCHTTARNDKSSKVSLKTIQEFEKNAKKINQLRRCTKCILPETIPYIEFDKEGVCNFCRSYVKIKVESKKDLEAVVKPYRRNDGKPDCLVTFSGGRDSSYGLHYIKKVLKMNPVAYSYDWGMLTDLGRRNQSRMTAKLGVEHILISADIKRKRENIRKNVQTWLRRPNLGTVPLFMAGDKQYFYYANKLGRQMGINLITLCVNPLEKTDFKFGFCGIKPQSDVTYRLKLADKIKLASFYGKEYVSNPGYLNSSLMDTLFAYFSYYLIPHDYLSLYDYIYWDEAKIEKTLLTDYNWEIAPDTKTTWRIGDGTAPFYNYIYYVLAGFTENDTFRSNQIREGVIDRQTALQKSQEDNLPRYNSMQWYCQTVGIDLNDAIIAIHRGKKLY